MGITAGISITCAVSFYWAKHSAFVRHHISDTRPTFSRKLKKISLPSSLSISSVTGSSSEDIVPVPSKRIFTFDSAIQKSINRRNGATSESNLNGQSVDTQQTVGMPVWLQCDTPHTLAALAAPRVLSIPSPSYIDDDDVLTPISVRADSYGSVQPTYKVKHHVFNHVKYMAVFGRISHLVLSIWLAMFVTFLWFPGMISSIPSQYALINADGDWMAIIMVTEFNVCDYVGRQFLSSRTPRWLNERNLWMCALLRIVVYPLMILFYKRCWVSDWALHALVVGAALSNGWVASLSFMWFPRNVNKQQHTILRRVS